MEGMDCSGYTKAIYRDVFGVDLPHRAASQYALPILEEISLKDLRTGDLVFFSPNRRNKRINHVGVYLSEELFVHASVNSGVKISSLSTPYWKSRFQVAKRMKRKASPKGGDPVSPSMVLAFSPEPRDGFTIGLTGLRTSLHDLESEKGILFDQPERSLFGFQMGLEKSLFLGSLEFQLSAFRQYYDLEERTGLIALRDTDRESGFHFDLLNLSHFQGVRVASEFRPSEDVSVTTSFRYFSYGRGIDDFYLPTLSYGIDFSLAPSSKSALSIGFQFYGLKGQPSYLSPFDRDEYLPMKMAITYRQSLNKNLHLLFTSEYLERLVPGFDESMPYERKEHQNFSILLDFTY